MNKSNNLVKVKDVGNHKEFVFINGLVIGTAYVETDGYYVFLPAGGKGFWSSCIMKMIAEHLDELNKDYDCQIKNEIGPNQPWSTTFRYSIQHTLNTEHLPY